MSTEQTNPTQTQETIAIANAIAEGIRAGQLELPVIPQVASKVLKLTNDPNADMEDLSKLIHGDQTIASHVLRISNSAAYGSGEPIVSLQQAVTRLGMKLLGEIAIAVSIQSDIFEAPGFENQIRKLLRHALAAAAYGRELAKMRRRNVEGQFLCGLMHSIGQPICYRLIASVQNERERNISKDAAASIVASLQDKIASKVTKEWNLPAQLQTTTIYYKKYGMAPKFVDESAATFLSQLLATWALHPEELGPKDIRQDPTFEYLNFYPEDVHELLSKRDDVLSVVSSMEL